LRKSPELSSLQIISLFAQIMNQLPESLPLDRQQ
jgi:hypothetical protein